MRDFEKELEFMHRIDGLLKNAIEKNFKNLKFNGQGNSGPNFHAHISEKNSDFKETEYFYKGNCEFFHLTSISSLLSILNYSTFRFYNIHSSKDPQEYVYGAKLLDLTDRQTEIGKEYLYTFSFCSLDQLENKKV